MSAIGSSGNSSIVRCYSGHTYAQEPQSFLWEGQWRTVAAVTSVRRVRDRQSNRVVTCFTVKTDDGAGFSLSYEEPTDEWTIECVCPK